MIDLKLILKIKKFPTIIDANGIKLYLNDIVEDQFYNNWILIESNGDYFFKQNSRFGRMLDLRFSQYFRLKWIKIKY